MTIVWEAFAGGETRDTLTDGWSDNRSTPGLLFPTKSGDCAIVTTPVVTGSAALKVGSAQGYLGPVGSWATNHIQIMQFQFYIDTAPSAVSAIIGSNMGFVSDNFTLCLDASSRLQLFALAAGNTYYPISPPSAPLSTGAYHHIAWIVDPLTLGSGHTWHTVFVDSVPVLMCGGGTIAASTRAIYVRWSSSAVYYVDDLATGYSTDAADAPHLAQVPILSVCASHPQGAGLNAAFTLVPNSGERADQDWDDAAGNDGDTTYLYAATTSKKQDSDMQSADDLSWNASATIAHNPIHTTVSKAGGTGTKWHTYSLVLDSLGNELAAAGGIVKNTSYGATGLSLARSSGSWGRADLGDMVAGCQTATMDHDTQWNVTSMMMQWLYCDNEYLPLAPRPMVPQAVII